VFICSIWCIIVSIIVIQRYSQKVLCIGGIEGVGYMGFMGFIGYIGRCGVEREGLNKVYVWYMAYGIWHRGGGFNTYIRCMAYKVYGI
jgi:hypothetical protein